MQGIIYTFSIHPIQQIIVLVKNTQGIFGKVIVSLSSFMKTTFQKMSLRILVYFGNQRYHMQGIIYTFSSHLLNQIILL